MLDIGFIGRRTHRYLPKEEVIRICKEKFDDSEQLEKSIETEHQAIVKILQSLENKQEKLMNGSITENLENDICNLDQLMLWSEKHEINEVIIKDLIELKEEVDKSIAINEGLQKVIEEAERQNRLIEVVSNLVQNQHNLVLTRSAWNWIENETNEVIKRIIVMLLLTGGNTDALRKLFRALLENKDLFERYMK